MKTRSMSAGVGLSAAVLAGGQSRRMGEDKALLRLEDGGPTLLELVLARVRDVADDVLIVASERPGYAGYGARVVPDAYPDAGTLGGIATALREASCGHCLVVACDMPFLNKGLLTAMASLPRNYDALVPQVPGESRQGSGLIWQTLHAIYGRSCLASIERRLNAGQLKVIGFFPDVRVVPIGVEVVRRYDPEERTFFNANTPAAVVAARSWVSQLRTNRDKV